MALARDLKDRFGLVYCEVVPTNSEAPSSAAGIAKSAAAFLEHRLRSDVPAIIALGTGRALRAAVEELPAMSCPSHQLVSLVGNISPDGSASFYDVLTRMAESDPGAALPHAAAAVRIVRRRARSVCQPVHGQEGAHSRTAGRLDAGRRRPDRPRGADLRGWFRQPRRSTGIHPQRQHRRNRRLVFRR